MTAMALFLAVYAFSWTLLWTTEAELFLPNPHAARDRLRYALLDGQGGVLLVLRIRILLHIVWTYAVAAPLSALGWLMDELLFPRYHSMTLDQAVIVISVPRAGTMTFHRTLALDTTHFVTPCMLELVFPFLWVHTLFWTLHASVPQTMTRVEGLLKYVFHITPEVDARHPVQLFGPDADDILLGEWHWVSTGSIRTFPVPEFYLQHYQMNNATQRRRSLRLHQRLCQKIVYGRGTSSKHTTKRLLLRSHMSPCIADLQQLYPTATFVGIVRNPTDVLPSFAGLCHAVLQASTGVDIFSKTNSNRWTPVLTTLLADLMRREADLYSSNISSKTLTKNPPENTDKPDESHQPPPVSSPPTSSSSSTSTHRCRAFCVSFDYFKGHVLECVHDIYQQLELPVVPAFRRALEHQKAYHDSYKERHIYRNPHVVNDLHVDIGEWKQQVQAYAQLQSIAIQSLTTTTTSGGKKAIS